MRTNEKTQQTGQRRSIRASLREVWEDSARAHRALFRVSPYDDYLLNRRADD